ncbi:hypothetical protein [Streptomyces zaehneri]|uniref:hypothetical protein n=1 Tax=Streptomyces zaehneri TaxID=3051180 RepID=UPI0028D325B8|nr:hypothetical protein [Streptomyces sp. DSM 40713]
MPKFWIGSREYPSKKAAQEAVRDVLYGYSGGSIVDQEADHLLLLDLLGGLPRGRVPRGC